MTSLITPNHHKPGKTFLQNFLDFHSVTKLTLNEPFIDTSHTESISAITISFSLTRKKEEEIVHIVPLLFVDGANGFTASGEAANAPLAEKPPKDVDDTVSSAQMLYLCT